MNRTLQMEPLRMLKLVLGEHVNRYQAEVLRVELVGSRAAKATIRRRNEYFVVEAAVPQALEELVHVDGALCFALIWEADWKLSNGRGLLYHGELFRSPEQEGP